VFDFNLHVSTPPGYEVEPERAGVYDDDNYESFADPIEPRRATWSHRRLDQHGLRGGERGASATSRLQVTLR